MLTPKILPALDDAAHTAMWRAVLPQVLIVELVFAPDAIKVAIASVFSDPAAM